MHHYVTSVFSCVLPAHLITRVTAVTALLLWEIQRLLSHLSKCSWLVQLPSMFLISTPSRSTSFDNEAAHSICLKGVRPMFGCKACSGGQQNAYRCARQGDVALFGSTFCFLNSVSSSSTVGKFSSLHGWCKTARIWRNLHLCVSEMLHTFLCTCVSTLSPFLYALFPLHIKTPA